MTAKEQLIHYSRSVIDGQIVACVKHRQACERFLRDIAKTDNKEWEWDFDNDAVERFYKWCGLFTHYTGSKAGEQFILTDFQKFIVGNIYGFWNRENGQRRYRKAYIQIARKQGKSYLLAVMALYEMSCMGEPYALVQTGATKKEQARHVWQTAEILIKNSILKDSFEIKYDQSLLSKILIHKRSNSIFVRLSKADKTNDGSNPSFGIIDEVHQIPDTAIYDQFISGQKNRKNPLLIMITTAGFELNFPAYREFYPYVSKILNGTIEDDRYFTIIAELDRNETGETIITDDGRKIAPNEIIDILGSEESIRKSNPVCGWDDPIVRQAILEQTEEAHNNPAKLTNLFSKTYNIWCHNRPQGYMDIGKWSLCKREKEEVYETFTGKGNGIVYCGIDLSTKIDLTAVSWVCPYIENDVTKYAILTHAFMPSETFHTRIKEDKIPYDMFQRQGYLTVTDGAVVEYKTVVKYIIETAKKNNWTIKEVCIDPWGSAAVTQDLQNENLTVVEIIQGIKTLSEPTKTFKEMVFAQRIIHENDPLLNFCMGNAITRQDHNGNIMLDKSKSTARIDNVAAIMNAFTRVLLTENSKNNNVKKVSHGPIFI